MKQILFISTVNLHTRNGGALATLAYYNAFKHLYSGKIDLALPAEYCYGKFAEAIPVPRRNSFVTYSKIFVGHFHRYRSFFNNYLRKYYTRYDLVVINGGFYAGDMVEMFQSYGLKVIVIHHNYEPEYHLDNKTLPTLGGITSYFVAKNERNAYKKADLNAFLTQSDIFLHQQHYGNAKYQPFLLGVFEPESCFRFPGEQSMDKCNDYHSIVITGSMNSVQTIYGIMDFKSKYFPIVKKILPDWKVIIAGRDPDQKIFQFAHENSNCVEIISNPENMDRVIEKGSIFLCPTNVGGGLKLRLMDGLRNGRAVLTHEVSARGYDRFFNQPFFQVYNDKESFANGLKALSNLVEKDQKYNDKICSIYRSTFSFEAGCERIKALIGLIDSAIGITQNNL